MRCPQCDLLQTGTGLDDYAAQAARQREEFDARVRSTAVKDRDIFSLWLRFAAFLVDRLIVGVLSIPGTALVVILFPSYSLKAISELENAGWGEVPWGPWFYIFLISGLTQVLYFSLLQSSTLRGSFGKRIFGATVVDAVGDQAGFGQNLIRESVKAYISGPLLGIGYIMAIWTQDKQALHDIVAGTLVVDRDAT
jgi:uncharacterized RDD family membrane protein YckC